jgi:hypothetical protein
MTATRHPALTVEAADAALKPFGLRVTPWSSVKFLVWKGDDCKTYRLAQIAELIDTYRRYA